jgi:PRTRC genetic system protein A
MKDPQNPFDAMFENTDFPDPFDDSEGGPDAKPGETAPVTPLFPAGDDEDQSEVFNLGNDGAAPNPFETESEKPADAGGNAESAEKTETPADRAETERAETEPCADPGFPSAQREIAPVSVYAKPPVFSYASAEEPIEDLSQTFDALRIAKSDDFPELEDGNSVSWEVNYGRIKKHIATGEAKKTKIGGIKSEIESSKEFIKDLKSSKDKYPTCYIKPKVTAQKKGRSAAYKGVFASLEEARASGKAISLVPGRDGIVYEIRRDEAGEYITPAGPCAEFTEIRAGFTPALPPVPLPLLLEIIAFFRVFMGENGDYEAIANIYWDREREEYRVFAPKQRVTRTSAESDLTDAPDPARYLHVIDVHSHNSMPALFSAKDDRDEQATRVYAVLGELDRIRPAIGVRIANGGKHLLIEPSLVFASCDEFCARADRKALLRGESAPSGRRAKGAAA